MEQVMEEEVFVIKVGLVPVQLRKFKITCIIFLNKEIPGGGGTRFPPIIGGGGGGLIPMGGGGNPIGGGTSTKQN